MLRHFLTAMLLRNRSLLTAMLVRSVAICCPGTSMTAVGVGECLVGWLVLHDAVITWGPFVVFAPFFNFFLALLVAVLAAFVKESHAYAGGHDDGVLYQRLLSLTFP